MRLQVSKAAAVPRILHCRPATPPARLGFCIQSSRACSPTDVHLSVC
jgi:hypothetical protein